uniref:Protein kinase domain-containing protein n=1 Tax=Stegastes partitus TaxID=144197 RepID=A0A3B5B1Y1_9TELE
MFSNAVHGKSTSYRIEEILGEGGFGKVAKSRRADTKELVAIKMSHDSGAFKHEVAALLKLQHLDGDRCNIVRFIEHFTHKTKYCLVFELLDLTLFDYWSSRRFNPLHLYEIRVIAQQMLVALDALKSIGLVHSDIKLDNIVLVNHRLQPYKIKLIDFGCAAEGSKLERRTRVQTLPNRSPDVILGLPLTEAIDMWSLGALLTILFTSKRLTSFYSVSLSSCVPFVLICFTAFTFVFYAFFSLPCCYSKYSDSLLSVCLVIHVGYDAYATVCLDFCSFALNE